MASVTGEDQHLVTVVEENQEEKPKFVRKPLPELKLREGDRLEISAHIFANPVCQVKWMKDGRELVRSNQIYHQRLTPDGDYLLEAERAVAKTSGLFTFAAWNQLGEVRAETKVQVVKKSALSENEKEESIPKFVEPLMDTIVALGKPLSLKCKLSGGESQTSIGWFFTSDADVEKSVPLSQLAGLWTEYRRDLATAEIRSEAAVKTQQGVYQCVASNKNGKTVSSARVCLRAIICIKTFLGDSR